MHATFANGIVTYDIPAIEQALVAEGASPEEADKLTDILHLEGWDRIWDVEPRADYNYSAVALRSMIDWTRDGRDVFAADEEEE